MRVTMVPTKSLFDEPKGKRRLPASRIEWMTDWRDLLRKQSLEREKERKGGERKSGSHEQKIAVESASSSVARFQQSLPRPRVVLSLR